MVIDTLLDYGVISNYGNQYLATWYDLRTPRARYWCKLLVWGGQTKRNRDVELTPCGIAYTWILWDLHTLARHWYCASPNTIKYCPKKLIVVLLSTGIVGIAAPFFLRGGSLPTLGGRVSCDTLGSRQRPGGRRHQRCCVWHRLGVVDRDDIGEGGVSGLRPVSTQVSHR